MNTIKTLKLLGRLAELVEIWQEPTADTVFLSEFGGWLIEDSIKPRKERAHVRPRPEGDKRYSFEEAWNHKITQNAFKAEVRNVCLEIDKQLKPEWEDCKGDWSDISLLFHGVISLCATLNIHVCDNCSYPLAKLCQKLGTSLLEEGEQQ